MLLPKIVDYTLLRSHYDNFDTLVRQSLKDGWQPFGNPWRDEMKIFYQAMVKYSTNNPSDPD